MHIRAPKDFWSGVMFIAFAAVGLIAARSYSLGTPLRMGPGYFPLLLGSVLALIGVILVARSFAFAGEPVGRIQVVPLAVITAAVVLFGLLLPWLGLVVALMVAIGVSALASRDSKPLEVAALALVLAVFSVVVFVYGLRLTLPVWPSL
jgi:Tripartite tricarboxylate transporter TctB family